jgi:hypothetical protein
MVYLAILIHRQSLSLDELSFQIFQIRCIEIELPPEGTIGQAPPTLEHSQRGVEDVFKSHRQLSSLPEASRDRQGICVLQMPGKGKQEVGYGTL